MKAGKDFIGVGVGATILNNKNEILLLKRRQNISEGRTTSGMWSIPGGEVEFMERIEDAVKREVREEIGVDVEIIKHIGYTDQILEKSKVHWSCHHFLCKIKSGEPKIIESDNFEKLVWFSIDKLPKDAGITHVIRPLYLLGLISEEEYKKRLEETSES